MKIPWRSRPPARGSAVDVRVVTVRSGQTARKFVLLGDPVWLPTHFAQDRTCPCLGEGPCPHCPPQRPSLPVRWKGYAPAQVIASNPDLVAAGRVDDVAARRAVWIPVVLELTEGAGRKLEACGIQGCRGLVVEVSRPGHRRNGPLLVRSVTAKPGAVVPLLEAFDVKPILLRMWGLPDEPAPAQGDAPETLPFEPPAKEAL